MEEAPPDNLIRLDEVRAKNSVTSRVLRELGSEDGYTLEMPGHGGGELSSRAHDEEEDEELHVDERWLVSYADMMTLLFGLFVMLYSMVGSFDLVKSSAAKRFGGAIKPPQGEADDIKRSLEQAVRQRDAASAKVLELDAKITALQGRIDGSEKKNAQLLAQLAESRAKPVAPVLSSLTIVMKWSTSQHDLDLVVRDPEGRVFDFKHRRYPGHPGNMVLDSRHGPGAELWQSEKILPGTYEATAIFYNPYGNPEPAQVSLSILTARGSVDLAETSLSFEKNPKRVFSFTALADGTVKLVK